MRLSKTALIILLISIVFLTSGMVPIPSLDEITISMKALLSDAQQYSGLVDMAFKELRSEDADDLHELTETINQKAESILQRSQAIAQQIEAYQGQAWQEGDAGKLDEVTQLLQQTEQVFNPAFQQVGTLTKLVYKRNVQDILKVLARELDRTYQRSNDYPERLDQFSALLGKQPYQMSYQKIDPGHFKIEMAPLPQALSQGVVLDQKFVLSEDKMIRIYSLSNKLTGTVALKDLLK